jgi:molybdenum cofactor cytidylyltransferase
MGRNKLLELLEGRPILRHVVEAAQGSSVATTAVVVGHQAEQVRAAVAGAAVQVVECPHYAEGLSASLKAGLAALPNDIDAAIVLLGDMPDITAAHIDQLIAAFSPDDGRTIVVPTHAGKRGNPVLWGRAHFVAMIAESSGDTGAKHLIGRHADEVVEVDLGTDAIFLDVDTPEALAAVTSRAGSHRP